MEKRAELVLSVSGLFSQEADDLLIHEHGLRVQRKESVLESIFYSWYIGLTSMANKTTYLYYSAMFPCCLALDFRDRPPCIAVGPGGQV